MYTLLPNGIYPPLPTFFDDQEELDLVTLQKHMLRLIDSGIAGYVLMGSNGEAVHLTFDERASLIRSANEARGSGEGQLPLIVGCSDQSTRLTIGYCLQAADCGGDVALVLPPFYYRGAMDKQAVLAHYCAVADQSPLPVLIYNMPANTAGLDLDTETVCELAQHPNIIGLKDSSGNVVKLAQIVANAAPDFQVFAGSASFLLPTLVIGGVGAVAALANVFPHEVCHIQALFEAGELEEARQLQARIIPANAGVTSLYNVPGLKAALELTAGYGGKPRRPLLPLSEQHRSKLAKILQATPLAE